MFQWHLEYWHRFLQANVKMLNYPFMFQFSEKYWHRFLQANDANFGTQVSVSNEILTQIATSKCEKFKFTFHFSMSLRILTLVSKVSSKLMKSQLPKILWQLKCWQFSASKSKNNKVTFHVSMSREILTQISIS